MWGPNRFAAIDMIRKYLNITVMMGNNLDNNQHTNKLDMFLQKEAQVLYQ